MSQNKPIIDAKKLSKKYRTNVQYLIRAWKKGRSDSEIACSTGIDLFTLRLIRSEIELAHRRQRLENKKRAPGLDQISKQRHIFLRPLT
ncbi:hypothetical protein [Desulfofalx alkaliphila]|uniref:hypothetical protein n=1 Tax=Desulfofalx alkaliphila TaxID=105483 RepID=UPI0004E22646|nr:hypothetical protein [Desulfofalx alkaliphila]